MTVSISSARPPAQPTSPLENIANENAAPPQQPVADRTIEGWNTYWPRNLLDTAPRIVEDLPLIASEVLEYPAGGQASLFLYIGADGAIDRVEVATTNLPEKVSAAIARHFQYSRFFPGTRHGRQVRSLMRIEVVLQSQPIVVPSTATVTKDNITSAREAGEN